MKKCKMKKFIVILLVICFSSISLVILVIITEIKKRKKLTLFNDYIVSSIDTDNLSKIIIKLFEKDFSGIVNVGCRNSFSKKDFILKLAKKINLKIYDYETVSAKRLITKRQLNCALDASKIEGFFVSKFNVFNWIINNLHKALPNRFPLNQKIWN